VVVGLNGSLPEELPVVSNWKWETSYNYGRNESTQASHGSLIVSHLRAALGPTFNDAGTLKCGTSKDDEVEGCVPLDLLHPGVAKISPDAINYLTFTGTQSGFNDQHTALATASGKVVDLPNHGDISVAIGGDYRFERGGQQPDPLTATGDTTGNANAPTLGSYNVLEAFGELSIVPYSGGDMLKWVELNAAGRAYKYNQAFGSGVTGKVTGLVRFAGGIAARGTFGNSFRAPNVSELFSGQADSFPSAIDPCDARPPGSTMLTPLEGIVKTQCERDHGGTNTSGGVPLNSVFRLGQQQSKIGGNPDLKPESANVLTGGLVYEPLRGLALTLDYWRINITNAITQLNVSTILESCYQGGNEKYCDRVHRDPDNHSISRIDDLQENIGGIATSGLDFSAAYQWHHPLGTFRHTLEGTYLFKYNIDVGTIDTVTNKEKVIHGRGYYDLGVLPDLKANLFTTWSHPSGLGAGFNVRFVDSFVECQNNDCNVSGENAPRVGVDKYFNGDLFVAYALKTSQGTTNVTVGVNNVLNVKPPTIYENTAQDADPSAYDFLGRQVYLRLSQLF
jgi:outer membrane receptor protein involved in Fe transport